MYLTPFLDGYQALKKCLKDRKSRILNFDDVGHYRKIVLALGATAQMMQQSDEIAAPLFAPLAEVWREGET